MFAGDVIHLKETHKMKAYDKISISKTIKEETTVFFVVEFIGEVRNKRGNINFTLLPGTYKLKVVTKKGSPRFCRIFTGNITPIKQKEKS